MIKHIINATSVFAIASCFALDAHAYVKRGYVPEYNQATSGQYIAAHFVLSPDYYVRADGEKQKLKTPLGATFAYGFGFDNFRTEIEAKYLTGAKLEQSYNIDTFFITENIKLDNLSIILNAYYDMQIMADTSLFAGFGLGYLNTKISDDAVIQDAYYHREFVNVTEHKDAFAYQFILGLGRAVSANTTFDLQYHFTGTSQVDGAKLYGHEVLLGLRFNF